MKRLLLLLTVLVSCDLTYRDTDERLDLVNSYRSTDLIWDNDLEEIASIHSTYMDTSGYYSHEWKDGTNLRKRLETNNYKFTYADENIARGCPTFEDVFYIWMDNPCHRDKMLDSKHTHAAYYSVNGYWTLILTKKR